MVAKHEEDNYSHPLNDPHLWLEIGAIDRLDKNWVYGMLTALTQDTRVSRSVSMVGTQHSDFNQTSSTIEEMVWDRIL